jgi:hypothetical protein
MFAGSMSKFRSFDEHRPECNKQSAECKLVIYSYQESDKVEKTELIIILKVCCLTAANISNNVCPF